MNTAEAQQKIIEWILSKNPKIDPTQIDSTTALLEKKILSSLHIMDLILFIEKTTGRRADLTQLKPTAFKTVDSIVESFFYA